MLLIAILRVWFIPLSVGNEEKLYVGSTITSFRMRFNNHKSSHIDMGRDKETERMNIYMLIFLVKGIGNWKM